jgi:hypothetical protein
MNSRPTPWIQIFGPRETGLGNHNPVLAHLVSQFTIHFVPEITTGTIDDLEIELSVPLQSLDSSGLPALTPEQSRQAIDLVADSPDSWPDWTLAEGPEFLSTKPEPPDPDLAFDAPEDTALLDDTIQRVYAHVVYTVTIHFLVDLTAGTISSIHVDQTLPLRTLDDEDLTPEQRRSAIALVTSSANQWPGWTRVETPEPSTSRS